MLSGREKEELKEICDNKISIGATAGLILDILDKRGDACNETNVKIIINQLLRIRIIMREECQS